MAFGIGINTETPVQEGIKGKQIPIACECWFDSTGQIVPRLFKYQDKCGAVRTIRDIRICYMQLKNYAGVPSMEYECEVICGGIRETIKLIFFMERCRWVMITREELQQHKEE